MFRIITYALLSIANAYLDSRRIKANKYIHHTREYLLYLFLCMLVGLIGTMATTAQEIIYAVGVVFIESTIARTAFFNFSLNKFRGLSFTYEGNSNALTDIILKKLKIRFWYINVAGLVAFIAYLLFYKWIH